MCSYGQLVLNLIQLDLSVLFSICLVHFSHSVVSISLLCLGLQLARLPYASPTPGACSSSCPSTWWCHPTISSSVFPFSSCLQSLLISVSFPMSQLFPSGGQITGASTSASVFPVNIQDWFFLGWTGLISLQSKGISRVFSNTIVQRAYMCVICQWHHIPPVGI